MSAVLNGVPAITIHGAHCGSGGSSGANTSTAGPAAAPTAAPSTPAPSTPTTPPSTGTTPPASTGQSFHIDPANGSPQGDGSAANPWQTLEAVIARGDLSQVQPGDQVLLHNGYHGEASFSGQNTDFITIAAAPGEKPQLGRLEIREGEKWKLVGLTVSPSFTSAGYSGSIVTLGERGPSTDLILEDCYIYSALSNLSWSLQDWIDTNNGVNLGRHGTGLTARNNHILNTRFALSISSFDSLAEGNIIENFSGDGIRATRDGITVQYNIIKNAYASETAGDANHDDGIQCFLFNVGTGTLRRLTIRGNIINNREDPQQLFPSPLQGIGFFDGPLVDFLIEDNVIETDHWHGISLYDAQNSVISGNVVDTLWNTQRQPWIKLGEKNNLANGNTVRNNYARSFHLSSDSNVSASNNLVVTAAVRIAQQQALLGTITQQFGKSHPVSNTTR
ncbi:MAG: right-handed parallel beta-helix repeat-containing protein [Planctomycetota bacterium]|nr:right-handed parallel beta-helix repeat-containing protein [Planctomycetota bacterium]